MFRYNNTYTVIECTFRYCIWHNEQLPLQFLHISVSMGWGREGSLLRTKKRDQFQTHRTFLEQLLPSVQTQPTNHCASSTEPGKTNRANIKRGNCSQNNNCICRNVLSSPSKSNLFHAYLTI